VSDDAVLDEIVDKLRAVLVDAGRFLGLPEPAAV
jgi:hypothetical protein